MNTILTGDGDGAEPGELVKEGSDSTFAADVIEASQAVPVIVAFGSPRSQQCQQVEDALEKAVLAHNGGVKLVKINIDKDFQIAQQLQIQSVPAVLAFDGGRPVDGFAGPQTDNAVRQFVDRLAGGNGGDGSGDEMLDQARALLNQGDTEQALAAFGQIMDRDPKNPAAIGGAAQCLIRLNKLDEARELLSSVPDDKSGHSDVAAARAALELAEQADESGDIGELEKAVEKKPGNHQARYDLSVALASHGRQAEAVDHLLEIIKADKDWQDGKARTQLLKIFEALGPSHPASVEGRRQLSTILFV